MLIEHEHVGQFLRRIRKQGRHLDRHLRGPRQRSFEDVAEARESLLRSTRTFLNAHNPYARSRFFRAVVGNLARHLGADPPDFELPVPLYFLTLIDKRHIVLPDEFNSEEWQDYSLQQIRAAYGDALFELNHIAMLDVALYVSTQRTHGVDRLLHFHTHCLVWGIKQSKLNDLCASISWEMRPLFAYTSGAKCSLVNPEDLRQMVWYVTKAPRSQYQFWIRETERSKQAARPLNGVNSVRVYKAMRDVTLDKLALTGGEGVRLLKRSLRDARSVSSPVEIPR